MLAVDLYSFNGIGREGEKEGGRGEQGGKEGGKEAGREGRREAGLEGGEKEATRFTSTEIVFLQTHYKLQPDKKNESSGLASLDKTI